MFTSLTFGTLPPKFSYRTVSCLTLIANCHIFRVLCLLKAMKVSYLYLWWIHLIYLCDRLHVGFICPSLVPKILFKGCPQELWIGDALFSGLYWDFVNPKGFGSSCWGSLGLPSCFFSIFIPLVGPQSALTLYPESHLTMLGSILDCYIQKEAIFII